ncbi:hypothetical protein ACOSQ3_003219 [Xanthoceras sorbifolium]
MFWSFSDNSQQFNYQRDPPSFAGVYEVSKNDSGSQLANLINLFLCSASTQITSKTQGSRKFYDPLHNRDSKELKETSLSMQLADQSIRYPKGMLEDVLVKVNELIFPVDFLILEMEEVPIPGKDLPIIIRRPFIRTTRRNAHNYPNNEGPCFFVDILDQVVQENFDTLQGTIVLEKLLIYSLLDARTVDTATCGRDPQLAHTIRSKTEQNN